MIAGGNNTLLLDACSHLLTAVFTAAFAENKTTASRQNPRLRYSYCYRLLDRNTHRKDLSCDARRSMAASSLILLTYITSSF
jgi:hypothetical protein